MCLTTTNPVVRVTRRKRRFWKVLVYQPAYEMYCTPFIGVGVRSGELETQPRDDFDPSSYNFHGTKYYEIEGGAYHLFRTWIGAQTFKKRMEGKNMRSMKVVRAIVPKGTKYMTGTYNGLRSLVVKRVVYKFKEDRSW